MPVNPPLPATFGETLRFLRKRAFLTQDALGRAVGYSREQIARLENGSRLPDLAVAAALFVPALFQDHEKALVEQFLTLAGKTRSTAQITIKHTRQTRLRLVEEFSLPAAAQHTPPAPLLPLIGRAAETADILAALQTSRLVTLLGAPGIGKSRLALEIARLSLPNFSDGAAFIPLAGATTPSDALLAVLRALSLTPSPRDSVEETIRAYLAGRRLLLVLDNCEHVLESAAHFSDWLEHAPHLKLLCTSRTPLDLYGEQEWPLAPLAVPNLAEPPDLARWQQSPALQLLLERVRAAEPGFALTADNLLPMATVCAALDGLPLALELAAVRLREMPPAQLAQQLLTQRGNGQLSSTWLQQSKRNVAERHRTLQAAIEWSYLRLTGEQQTAFARLGVFVGGCSAPAAEAVAGADEGMLTLFARASLLGFADGRVSLLETLRTFAHEQLTAGSQLAGCQAGHARYYAALGRQLFAGLLGDEQAAWMQRGLEDHENCLAALRWAIANEQGEIAIALAGSLWWFWYRRGLFNLGSELLAAALRLSTPDSAARATALNGLASIRLALDDYPASLAYHHEGLALRRQLGDRAGVATVLHNLGLTAFRSGDFAQALAWMEDSIAADPESDPMQAWAYLGIIALDMLDLPQARSWLERALARVVEQPEGWAHAFVMYNLADVFYELGELTTAKELAQNSLGIFTALGDSHYLPDPQLLLARIAASEGDGATALRWASLALEQFDARADAVETAAARLLFAEQACKRGEPGEAMAIYQQAFALRQTVKRPLSPREQKQYQSVSELLAAGMCE